MQCRNDRIGICAGLTILEMVIALTVMAIVFAAILPQFTAIRNSWDSRQAAAEALQNGRVLIDHVNQNLSKAVKITAVSGSTETYGYIEFEDNDENIFRYDIADSNYVEFGPVGDLYELAGPVSQLQFICYDGNDFDTAITDVNDIRFIKVQTTLTNPAAMGHDKTFTAAAYLRTDCESGSDWPYRKKLTFNNSEQSEALVSFPVLVKLSSLNFDYSKAKSDGTDLRFMDADASTELKYHIEDWDSSGYSYIWVNVTNIDGNSDTDYIWMYYGNSNASDVQDESGTYDENYVGVWHLNETVTDEQSTGTHYDSTTNDYDGSQNGNDDTQGMIANGQVFDGDDNIGVASISAATDKTFSLWIYANALTGNYITLIEFADDKPWFGIYPWSGDYYLLLYPNKWGTTILSTGQWYHVVYTSDNSAKASKFYINGNDVTEGNPSENKDKGSPMGIAYYNDEYFNGIIDEVRVSNTARSADWIKAQYLSMNNSFITYGSEETVSWTGP